MHYILALYLLWYVFVLLYKIKTNHIAICEIDRTTSTCMKAILAISVVLHHLSQRTDLLFHIGNKDSRVFEILFSEVGGGRSRCVFFL